jgi:parallel beta-helix repeat protein
MIRASGTIYIRADGSINPPTAPISTVDNVIYNFTGNIGDSIVVERSNIIVDGKGFTLQGSGVGYGFDLSNVNNVTIRNTNIKSFQEGVFMQSSSYNTVAGNNITGNDEYGIFLDYSWDNTFYHNNSLDNSKQVYIGTSGYANVWDDGYPSGGNYWSDYTGVDEKSGPDQDQPGSDGIGDTHYVIDADNQDGYPLMNPYPWYALTITISVGGKTNPASGTYSYPANSTVQATAIPDANHLFGHWELDGVNSGADNLITVTMNTNHTLRAVFKTHDVAIIYIAVPYLPAVNKAISIKVTIENQGNFSETFDVSVNYTLRAFNHLIGTQTIVLEPGATITLTFTWTPTIHGFYKIKAYTSTIPDETDLEDNTRMGYFLVCYGFVLGCDRCGCGGGNYFYK